MSEKFILASRWTSVQKQPFSYLTQTKQLQQHFPLSSGVRQKLLFFISSEKKNPAEKTSPAVELVQ